MLMVRAGQVVDDFIEQLVPLLDKGDIIIDGGNTNFLILTAVSKRCVKKAFTSSVRVFLVVKKVHVSDLRSCRVAHLKHGKR